MALARRPSEGKTETKTPAAAPVDIDAAQAFRVISKGGSAAGDEVRTNKKFAHPLKFPADGALWEQLEATRKVPVVKLSRNTWILQAIAEKLEREGR